MWVIVIVTGLVLVFARSMQVEVVAAANLGSAGQAAAIEKGAEQYVLALVDTAAGDPTLILNSPGEAMQVGTGYFWLLRPALTDDDVGDYGLVDEASKFNINAGSAGDIGKIPGMWPDWADSIVDWRDADDNPTDVGAETSYYMDPGNGSVPYRAKNAPFESLDELLLVKDIGEGDLYGYDRDHDGCLSDAERNSGGPTSQVNSANGTGRGFFPYITVYSTEPNKDATGAARLNLNGNTSATQLQQLLTTALGQQRATQVLSQVRNAPKPYANVFDFAVKAGLKSAELAKVIDGLTTGTQTKLTGLVNVNTAPAEVLMCLPGLTQDDANTLIAKRQEALNSGGIAGATGTTGAAPSSSTGGTGTSSTASTNTNIAWVLDALPKAKVAAIGGRITGRSYQYSADILAVSGDGRSFKRVRVVVDGTQAPAKIIYRKDLTGLGWPLDEQTRQALRDGKGLDSTVQARGMGL